VAPPAPPVAPAPTPLATEPPAVSAPTAPEPPPRRPRGPPFSPRAVVADAARREARSDRRRVWKRDPLAEVTANWSQRPGPDDVPACIFCDDAYRGVVHNSGKGPDAFFYCCTCDKHFTRREADFFAGRRGVLT